MAAVSLAYDAPPSHAVPFASVALLPEPGDNCAIARTTVDAGTLVRLDSGANVALSHRLLEGHRFAVEPIPAESPLLSWGLPFGFALRGISPGEYVANASMLETLGARGIVGLPSTPNFVDHLMPFSVVRESFVSAPEVPLATDAGEAAWNGFSRPAGRGVGTRNYIVVIGTTSASAGFVRALEAAAKSTTTTAAWPSIDGVVAVAHTEGAGDRAAGDLPHNHALLVETLASYVLHPNVGAALLCDYGANEETVWARDVIDALGGEAASAVVETLTLSGDHGSDIAAGLAKIAQLLPVVGAAQRTPQPASALSIAQQCGGSDAFSGVSGNPTAGDAARRLIAVGGQAVLAETDELIGAEAYVLRAAKDFETATAFLEIIRAFKERLAWHGQTAEANPTGGNKMRGLYNIALKSLGAAKKKPAEVRLDGVLRYAERSRARGRGYFMMDSPGNDLESIAGQVATGCNIIHFITGNGSITNFPFVPTVKIVTTTGRFKLLERDMDFNAGRFQEGTPIATLGAELHALTLAVAGGARTVGERAGHSQVAIWRNWPQAGPTDLGAIRHGPRLGDPLPVVVAPGAPVAGPVMFEGFPSGGRDGRPTASRVGLVLPTSLCSGEVARLIADELEERRAAGDATLAASVGAFASLPHTEGCCTGYAEGGIALYDRVMLGHLTHPSVAHALCLEHGCEKTHNDYYRSAMAAAGLPPSVFETVGFASIQLDGGIAAVTAKVVRHFEEAAGRIGGPAPPRGPVDARALDIGLIVDAASAAAPGVLPAIAALVVAVSAAGGSVIVPAGSPALAADSAIAAVVPGLRASRDGLEPTLAFGQAARGPLTAESAEAGDMRGGLHVMDMPAVRDVTEAVVGLVAAGAQAIVALSTPAAPGARRPRPVGGHPFVPVVRVVCAPQGSAGPSPAESAAADAVLVRGDGEIAEKAAQAWATGILSAIAAASGPSGVPTRAQETAVFSVARGLTGVTT